MSTINYVRNLRGGGVVAARGHRCLALSARWAGCLKPPSPLLVGICVGLKPLSPLRVRNGRFGCVFGCRGDGGFNGRCLGASSGVVGFNVAMLLRLMREKVRPARGLHRLTREKLRPARPLQRSFREKTRPARHKTPILGHFSYAGRTISRSHPPSDRAGRTFSRTGSCDVATLKPMTPLQPLMQTNVKPPSPLRPLMQANVKPPSPLQPKNAPKTPISHPQRRWGFQLRLALREQRRRRFHARDL